jgi:hypothetical protein
VVKTLGKEKKRGRGKGEGEGEGWKKLTGMQAKFIAMKKKYMFRPIASMPTGQICATTIEPMDPADAEKLRPRARTAVGKIFGYEGVEVSMSLPDVRESSEQPLGSGWTGLPRTRIPMQKDRSPCCTPVRI